MVAEVDAEAGADAEVAVDAANPEVFDVLDVFGGFAELVKPHATLEGSIPLRAARACSPLLDGNRFGFQVRLTQGLTFDKSLLGVKFKGMSDVLFRAISGSLPRVLAEGLFPRGSSWAESFGEGIVLREEGDRRQVSLFTGLFVRPRPGYWLRLDHAGNRRNIAFTVEERWIANTKYFTPLVVTLSFVPDAPFPCDLVGEIATLAPFASKLESRLLEDEEQKKLGQAHFSFFDDKYFAQKKRASTKKYRQMVDDEAEPTLPERTVAGQTMLGPRSVRPVAVKTFLTPKGVNLDAGSDLHVNAFYNAVPLVCSYDGHLVHVEPEREALTQFAKATRQAWADVFGAETLEQHKGAMWYFTKYVTPHQPGEPYFFVKPPALLTTPPGYSTLIEGIPGPGYSVLRGVVATDVFHALPAVFRIDRPLQRIEIPEATPLARFIPFPRTLLDATFGTVEWEHAPRLRNS